MGRRLHLPLIALAALTALTGCGASIRMAVRSSALPISRVDAEARIALGSSSIRAGVDPEVEIERLYQLSMLAERLEQHGDAIAASVALVRLAQGHALAHPSSAAHERRVRVERYALALFDRLGDSRAVLALAESSVEGAGSDVLLRALEAHHEGPALTREVWARLDDRGRAQTDWVLRAPLGLGVLSVDEIRRCGPGVISMLEQRAMDAAQTGDLAQLRAAVSALRDVDSANPMVLACSAIERELARGVLSDETLLLACPGPPASTQGGAPIPRLLLGIEAFPSSEALPAALALLLLWDDAAGDAHAIASRHLESSDDTIRHLSMGVAAVAALATGDVGPFEAFERAHGEALSSSGWVSQVLPYEGRSEPDSAVAALARRARRRIGVVPGAHLEPLIRDAEASGELRQRALDGLMHIDYARAHFLASCVADRLSSEACGARLDALEQVLDPSTDDPELFDRLGDTITPGILYDLEEPWIDTMQAAAARWLDRRAENADGYTEAWVFARLSVALALGDVAGARALLEQRGALLTRPYLVGARIALLAAEGGADFYGIEAVTLPPLARLGESRVVEGAPLGYDCFFVSEMDEATAARCESFAASLDGAAPELLAATLAMAAVGSATADRDALLTLARNANPGGNEATLIEALIAEARGDSAAAAEAFLRLTLADSALPTVERRYLHHASVSGTPMSAIVGAIAASDLYGSAPRDVARVVEAAHVTDPAHVERLYDLDALAFVEVGEAVLLHRHFVTNYASLVGDVLRGAPVPSLRALIARRLMPLMAHLDGVVEARLMRAQIALLAGEYTAAAAVADRPYRGLGDTFPLPEASEVRDLIAAGSAVPQVLMDHLLFARPSGAERTAEALSSFLAPLENLAASSPALQPLLCGEEVRASNVPAALAACGPLHARAPSPLTWVRMSAPMALATGPVGLDVEAFFRSALEHTEGTAHAIVAWNDALRLARLGRTDESARAALLAQRSGFVAGAPAAWELAQVRVRGVELRARLHRSPSDQVYLALAQGDAALAWFYAQNGAGYFAQSTDAERAADPAYSSLCFVTDLAFWAQGDVAAGRIDLESLATWDRLRREGFEGDELEGLLARFADANVMHLALGVREADAGRHREAYDAIRPLLQDAPRASLAVIFRRSIGMGASRSEADETVAQLRSLFPHDPRLAVEEEAILPEALGTSDALTAFLAGVSDQDLVRLRPVVRVDSNGHASAAFPEESQPLTSIFGAQLGAVRLIAGAEPRLAHCEGEACLDSILPTFDAMGMSTIWRGEVTTQFGPGARALLSGPGGAALFTAVPRGSILFVLGVFGAPEAIAGRLRAYAMLERSFSPLDVAVPSGWAAVLAGEAPTETEVPIALRIEALNALSASSSATDTEAANRTCPVRAILDRVTVPQARESLLRTLYLGRANADQRLAVLRCADAGADGHALLGLAAALDPSAAIHTLGTTMLSHDGAAARTIADRLLEVDPGRALAGVAHRDSALPPFGGVELIIALPDDARRTLTSTLWARGTPAARALAVVAEQVRPGTLDHALVRETLRAGSAPDAVTASDVLYGSEDAADLDAARARLDALHAPLDEPRRVLALRLVWELARRLDRQDVARFATTAERLRESLASARDARLYEWSAERVEHELAVLRASIERNPSDLPEEVEESLEVYRGMRRVATRHRTSARVVSMLATEPLARVLPGAHWSYVRVPSPSLLIATLESMYRRLESGSASDGALARQTLQYMLEQANAALLAPDGGLDLSRPIECATADRFPRSWVCAAYVSDPDRVRDILAERRYGTNSGAWLAVEAARQARSLPIAAGGMPYELAGMLSEELTPAPPSAGSIVLRERARTEVDLDGVRVLRYATFVAREGEDTGTDTEHYLFTGDRLVMFGLEETARELLAEPLPASRTLAGQPRFRALTEDWTDGSVLQLVNVGFRARMLPEPLPNTDMSLSLSAWDEGLVGRIRMPFTEATTGVDELLARLPTGALSSMSFVPDPDREEPEPRTEVPAADDWRGYLLGHADRFALGWYGAGSSEASTALSRVWGAWTLVLGTSERLNGELSSWSLLPAEGATVRRDGLVFGRTGSLLVVSTDETAVRHAMTTPAVGSRAATAIVGSAHLDGARTAEVARVLSDGMRRDDPRRDQLELLAAILGLAREVSFEARADTRRRELVITARVDPNLGPPGEDHALIDELLRHARNAVTLPRALSGSDLRGTLRMTVSTTEPEVVARRGFGGHPRLSTEVRDASTLVLTLRPSDASSVVLTDAERATLLASTRAIRADAENVRAQALALAPPGTSPAEAARAIVTWVHDHIRYELTAEELDAPTVLERGRGDCSELARLTTALLRAAGVPAEMREGFLVVGAEMGAHAWVAYHDGHGFREIDPTAGRPDVDSGYLPSSVLTVMGLAAIGDLRITEVTTL
jgi:hypothetical protein